MSNTIVSYKFAIQNKIDLDDYLNQYNNVLRFSYNRFKDNPKYSLSDVEKIIKSTMNNIPLMDASLIKVIVNEAKSAYIKNDHMIFGSKESFFKLKKKQITKEQWLKERNWCIFLRGSSSDNNGNRKAKLDIIDNNSVILKFDRNTHIQVQLPKLRKKQKDDLSKLQILCEEGKACFSLHVNNDKIIICFDPEYLKINNQVNSIENRILSIDINPNFIGLSVINWIDEENYNIITKRIIEMKNINNLDQSKYQTNKRKHEVMNISKFITNLAKHYQCEYVCFERLKIKSKDNKKGKKYNKLVNNQWLRNSFISNIKKRCIILGIKYQEIAPEYSSFIGQIMNPNDYDSIAASVELSRRCNLFVRKYKKNQEIKTTSILYPEFTIGHLDTRWKEMLRDSNIISKFNWKKLYEWFKETRTSYRFLFSKDKFSGDSFRLFSVKSMINMYIFT